MRKLVAKNKQLTSNYQSGQSLFEVVIALGLVTLIITTVVALASLSIKGSSFSKSKSLATKCSQAVLEWLREEREADWGDFYLRAENPKWCVPSLSWEGATKVGPCGSADYIEDTFLTREVDFRRIDSDTVETTITVYWYDASGYHEVSTITDFTNWKSK